MKKEVRHYLSIGFLVLAVLILVYLFNLGMTGYAVSPLDHDNPTDCEAANYTWQETTGQNCTDIVDCTLCVVECETNCTSCETIITGGECTGNITLSENDCVVPNYTWQETTGQNCTDIVDCTLCVVECETNCTSCETIITGGECTGDVCDSNNLELCDVDNCAEAGGAWNIDTIACDVIVACDSDHLELCDVEADCTGVGYYWYDGVCNAQQEETDDTVSDDSEPSCSNDLTLCDVEADCTGVGHYWYEGVCNEGEEPKASLSASEISALLLNPGSSQETTVIVKNTGTKSLTSCKIRPVGEFNSWVLVSKGTANINLGKQHEFSFNVTVPEETEEGDYSLRVSIGCSETFSARVFTVNVEKKKLEFEVISADRIRSNRVRIIYSLEELAGEDQDVVFTFSLVDVSNVEVGNAEVNQSIDANSIDEFRTNIEINESLLPINETTNETLESELTLNVNFNSEIYSSSVRETITLGAPIGGFAIFEGVGAGEAVIFVVVLFVLVFIFVFARRMRRKGKTLKDLVKGKDSGNH